MRDLFILGAGFSKAISPHMPVMAELDTIFSKEKRYQYSRHFVPNDFEAWLTYLATPQPWLQEKHNLENRALFLDVSKSIEEHLDRSAAHAIEDHLPILSWLQPLLLSWHMNRVAVITLNYDTLIERCAQSVNTGNHQGIPCSMLYPVALTPAGMRVAATLASDDILSFRLFKLHGSVNWFYSGRTEFFGEPIYYVPVTDLKDYRKTEQERGGYRLLRDKVPLIIPPVNDKSTYFSHETLRSLWRQAGDALHEAQRIFCLGYSFPKTDQTFRLFMHSTTQRALQFEVVDKNPEAGPHHESLLSTMGIKVSQRFSGDSAIADFCKDYLGLK